MNKEQPADCIDDNVIFQLSTPELITVFQARKNRADLAWGQIMLRATFYEQTQRGNNKLVRLLRECVPYLEHTDETDLLSRVTDALAEYQEQS